jgi:hypothetical protein
MVQPVEIEEPVVGAASYVPEPFQGLPDVFEFEEPNRRGWRLRHRASRTTRKDAPEQAPLPSIPEAPPAVQDPPAVKRSIPTPPAEPPVTAPTPPAPESFARQLPALESFAFDSPSDGLVEPCDVVIAEPPRAVQPASLIKLPPLPVPVEPDLEPAQVVVAPEPEPVVAMPEPEPEIVFAAPEPEPVAVMPEPEPEPEIVLAAPEPEPVAVMPEPEPEPEIVLAPPEPEPVAVMPEPEPEPVVEMPEPVPPVTIVEPAPPVVVAPAPAVQAPRPAPSPKAPAASSRFPRFPARPADTQSAPARQALAVPILPPPGLVTYVPDPFEPTQQDGSRGPVTVDGVLRLGHAVVLPQQRRSGARAAVVLLLVAFLGAGFFAWRQLRHDGASAAATTPTVAYRSKLGHFAARFPSMPTEFTSRDRIGKNRLTIRAAGDSTARVVVESIDVAPSLPKAEVGRAGRDLIRGLADQSSLTLKSQRRTTFRGHSAQVAQFWAMDGTPITVLATAYSGRQLFVIMGPTGEGFAALEKSFVALR